MIAKQLLEEAAQLKETMVFNRRYLHSHAETGFELKNTYAFVQKTLTDMGYGRITDKRRSRGGISFYEWLYACMWT